MVPTQFWVATNCGSDEAIEVIARAIEFGFLIVTVFALLFSNGLSVPKLRLRGDAISALVLGALVLTSGISPML